MRRDLPQRWPPACAAATPCTGLCAAARLPAPLAALSTYPPDEAVERGRHVGILAAHKPRVLVMDGLGCAAGELLATEARRVRVGDLWAEAWEQATAPSPELQPRPEAALCYGYTGGAPKASRCAHAAHRLARHEVQV